MKSLKVGHSADPMCVRALCMCAFSGKKAGIMTDSGNHE